eukprot:TRINITY_DN363_c0_g2_i1.p3 TRINITY_DN363_c0_g2~~TRINITY_DN363_c0_g2_i1.p3  ORF type:complete len:154 (-),score=19.16 TRINITY_DN363_c0_g2_i1:35-496(-)
MQITLSEKNLTQVDPDTDVKKDWFLELRKKVCPLDMLNTTKNELNQDFFRPDVVVKFEHRKYPWGEGQQNKLIAGLGEYGFGKWKEIQIEYFGDYPLQLIIIRASRIVGRQDMSEYAGWKPSEEELKDEFNKNKTIGLQQGTWRFGCLMKKIQ